MYGRHHQNPSKKDETVSPLTSIISTPSKPKPKSKNLHHHSHKRVQSEQPESKRGHHHHRSHHHHHSQADQNSSSDYEHKNEGQNTDKMTQLVPVKTHIHENNINLVSVTIVTDQAAVKKTDNEMCEHDRFVKLIPPHKINSTKISNSQLNGLEMLSLGKEWLENKSRVFISFDIEQWERNGFITEIGLSIYNPLSDSMCTLGSPFTPRFRTGHYILKGTEDMRNGRYVPDNKDDFLFGKSVVISKYHFVELFQNILNLYVQQYPNKVVFVGQSLKGDITALKSLGVEFPADIPILDTEQIWKVGRPHGKSSLQVILSYLKLPYSHLHNAGNDAYHTLAAFCNLCDEVTRKILQLDDRAISLPLDTRSKRERCFPETSRQVNSVKQAIDLFFN